jgi:hypothetical protein
MIIMPTTEHLKTELETYEREKSRLVAESEGKHVLIQGSEVSGVWDTYVDALNAGYTKFQLTPFLVKQIEGIERVHFFTRDLVCPS